jgi:hypothetical protein
MRDFDYTQFKMIKYAGEKSCPMLKHFKYYVQADKRERLLAESQVLLVATANQAQRTYAFNAETMM